MGKINRKFLCKINRKHPSEQMFGGGGSKLGSKKKLFFLILLLLLLIGGVTYASFNIDLKGQNNIVSRPAKVSLTYNEPEQALISNLSTLSKEEGKKQDKYFEFTVSSTSDTNYSIQYNIYLTEKETNTLNRDNIYLYLTEVIDNKEVEVFEPLRLSSFSKYYKYDNSYIIESDWFNFDKYIEEEKIRTYRLRLWTDLSNSIVIKEDGSQSINIEGGSYEYTVNVDTFATPEYCFTYTKDETNKTAEITDYNCYEGNTNNYQTITYVAIPDKLNGYDVTSIGVDAFRSNELTGIAIPNSITKINGWAFGGNNLTSVIIPDSVTSLMFGAFLGNKIEYAKLPNNITEIPSHLFYDNKLKSITIPESVTTIGSSAFDTNSLESINIPSNVTSLGEQAFCRNNITSAVIPDSITQIPNHLFYSNKLKSVVLPKNLVSIGNYAFSYNKINAITLPDTLETIGLWAFIENNLTSVTIPNNVTVIGGKAFHSNKINSLTIGNSVTTISEGAFYDNKLTNVIIPESVTTIEEKAFNRNQLTSVKIKGKSSSDEFTTYGELLWGWASGYGDSNIEWNYS